MRNLDLGESRLILVVTKLYPTPADPNYGRIVAVMLKALRERGLESIVIVPVPFGSERFNRLLGAHPRFRFNARRHSTKTCVYLPYVPTTKAWLDSLQIAVRTHLYLTLSAIRPHVVYSHWYVPDGAAARYLAKWFGIPLISHNHASEISHYDERGVASLAREAMRYSTQNVCVSADCLTSLVAYEPAARATVVHNGIDDSFDFELDALPALRAEARLSLGLQFRTRVVVTVGSLIERKNLGALIRAMKARDLVWYVIGKGELRTDLEALAGAAGIDARFLGPLEYADVRQYLLASDAFCLVSKTESFGQVFAEALLCGTPVLGPTVGGVPEIVGTEDGVLVDPLNNEAIRDGLSEVLGRSWDHKAIAGRAKRFLMRNMADDLARVIKASLKGR